MLCTFHHKLVHEGCWDIRGKPDGDIVFIRPDGRDFVPLRPRLRDDIRERILWPSRTGVPSAMELCVNASNIPT